MCRNIWKVIHSKTVQEDVPGGIVGAVTMMVYGPHRKKCRHPLAYEHGAPVIPQKAVVPKSEYGRSPQTAFIESSAITVARSLALP